MPILGYYDGHIGHLNLDVTGGRWLIYTNPVHYYHGVVTKLEFLALIDITEADR